MSPTAAPPRRRSSGPVAPTAPAPRRRPRPPVRDGAATTRTTSRTAARPAARPSARTTTAPAKRAPARTPTTRRVVPPPAPRKQRPRLRIALLVLAVSTVVITIAGFHAFLAQTQVQLQDIRSRTDRAEARYESLRLENGQLTSPARITTRAAELGLGPPSVAPVAIPLAGEVPKRGGSSATLADWAEVKRHLDAAP